MASAFWTLEDGSTLARNWSAMAYMLELITNELKEIKGAEDFSTYLDEFVFREGDESNGYGGIWRSGESILFNFDLRTFAPQNRAYFWQATQRAFSKLKTQKNSQSEGMIGLLLRLLSMRKKIRRGGNPLELNDMRLLKAVPTEQLGPGW